MRITEEEKACIKKLYAEGRSLQEISGTVKRPVSFIYNVLTEYKNVKSKILKRTDENSDISRKPRLTAEEKEQIIELYMNGRSVAEIVDIVNRSVTAINHVLDAYRRIKGDDCFRDRKDLATGVHSPVTDEEKERMLELREDGYSFADIAKLMGNHRSASTVHRIVSAKGAAGIESSGRPRLTVEEKGQIINLHKQGANAVEIAKKVGRSVNAVRRMIDAYEKSLADKEDASTFAGRGISAVAREIGKRVQAKQGDCKDMTYAGKSVSPVLADVKQGTTNGPDAGRNAAVNTSPEGAAAEHRPEITLDMQRQMFVMVKHRCMSYQNVARSMKVSVEEVKAAIDKFL